MDQFNNINPEKKGIIFLICLYVFISCFALVTIYCVTYNIVKYHVVNKNNVIGYKVLNQTKDLLVKEINIVKSPLNMEKLFLLTKEELNRTIQPIMAENKKIAILLASQKDQPILLGNNNLLSLDDILLSFPNGNIVNNGGSDFISSYISFGDKEIFGTEYWIVILTDKGEIYSETNKVFIKILIAILVIKVFFLWMIYLYITCRISRPLMELIQSTKDIMNGDAVEIKVADSNNELKSLSNLMNNVIGKLLKSKNEVLSSNLQLIYNERKIKSILDSIVDGLITFDEDAKIKSFSPSAEKMFGCAEKEIINQNIISLFNEESFTLYESIMEYIKSDTSPIDKVGLKGEFVALRSDQTVFLAELSASKVPQKIDNKYLLVATIRDISEYKKKDLEVLLAKERAEKANRAKDDFLSNMSHEMRTPLSGILSMIDLLMITELNKEQGEYIEVLKSSSETFLRLVGDILDYSNIESSQGEIVFSQVNTIDIINEIVVYFTPQAINKNLNFSSYVDTNIPQNIISYHRWLRNIFYHLINNAIKFTKEGYVALTVKSIEENGVLFLVIKVEDTGIGISHEDFSTIFLPFNQVDNSDNRQYGGTGLGLTIVQRIVDMFSGKITVESEINSGSIFEVKLPIKLP